MLTDKEKQQIEDILTEKLSIDSSVVKSLNSNLLIEVKQLLADYRESYLKEDSDIYEARADKLALQLQNILSSSIKSFDVKTNTLKKHMEDIAEKKVHAIVNGKLDEILMNFNTIKTCVDSLSNDIRDTRKKTIHYAYFNAMNKKPVRTILFTVLSSGFAVGTLFKVYEVKFDFIQISKSIVEFLINKI